MKYLQLFENFKPREDWRVGDIVVGAELKYCDNGDWIIPGDKYEIIDISNYYLSIKIKCLKSNKIYDGYWHKDRFMTEVEYNLKKFNI